MNMKRIRICASNALLIVFAMIVLAGATGFSYNAHYCHGKLSGVSFFTEIGIQQTASCGCALDEETRNAHYATSPPVLKKNSCCSNVSFFSKLNIESPSTYFSSIIVNPPVVIDLLFSNAEQLASERENIPVSGFLFSPPPLAGRKLVLYLSQQRIPLISYQS
jgi:hypothetical protein